MSQANYEKRRVAELKGRLKRIVGPDVIPLEAIQDIGIGSHEDEQGWAVDAMQELGYSWNGDSFKKTVKP